MIARIVIPLLLVIVLSDLYIDIHYFYHHYRLRWWKRLLWWMPCLVVVVYTCCLASIDNFIPDNQLWLDVYLFLVGLAFGPKVVFVVCSAVGWCVRKFVTHTHRNWGHYIGLILGAILTIAYLYGLTFGFSKVKVKRVDLSFSDLPASFDGFKIVHISDAHVGTFRGWRKRILESEIDSVNSQHADLVVFTGDIENIQPHEVEQMLPLLKRLPPMVMVLGNHDYDRYVKVDSAKAKAMKVKLSRAVKQLGTLLCNQSLAIEHKEQGEKIFVAGEENFEKPYKANLSRTMRGVPDNAFCIFLQHEPEAWRASILPKTHAQLTLSGHTHGGQMQLFGFRPTKLIYNEDYGLYQQDGRYLYVTAGLGGLMPFRLNMPNEVTVITLHKK